MKPPASKPSEEIEKIRQEQEGLHAKFQSLRENELFQLREQVSNLNARFWIAVAAYGTVATIIALFGANTYFREIPNSFKDAVIKATETIPIEVKRQVAKQVEAAAQGVEDTLYTRTEDLTYANNDFQKVLGEYEKGDLTLAELREIVKDRLRNEIVVALYADILLSKEVYPSAIELLEDLREQDIFPSKYRRPEAYTQAGAIRWIMSLREPSRDNAERMRREACRWLEDGVKKGRDLHSKTQTRMPLVWLVFLHLSQGDESMAMERARQYKFLGGNGADLSCQTKRKWFENLKDRRRFVEDGLKKIMAEVFDEAKPAATSE